MNFSVNDSSNGNSAEAMQHGPKKALLAEVSC